MAAHAGRRKTTVFGRTLRASNQRQERLGSRGSVSAARRYDGCGERSTSMIDTIAAATVDAFGLTDRGLVRDGNEDHFVIAQVNKSIEVRQTSLPPDDVGKQFEAAAAYLFAVADGVGGRPEGDLASGRTLSAMLSYLGKAASCFQGLDSHAEEVLLEKLEAAVRDVHEGLVEEYGGITSKLPATTLTMVLLVWPRAYHVQVGDSRAYVRRGT